MHHLSVEKEKWSLTQETLDKLLRWLDSDRQLAAKKYEKFHHKLIKFFEWRGCRSPEHYADKTFDRVMQILENNEKAICTDEPWRFIYGVASKLVNEYRRTPEHRFVELKPHLWFRGLDEKPNGNGHLTEEADPNEQRLAGLERCLQTLDDESRELILAFYQGAKGDKIQHRRQLAEQLKISPNALRIRAHRLRQQLEIGLQNCLKRRVEE